jgi:flagellar biosynthesis chaperone FliJ
MGNLVMEAVIQQIEWVLENSDRDIKHYLSFLQGAVEEAARSQERLKKAMDNYDQSIAFKTQAVKALELLRAAE